MTNYVLHWMIAVLCSLKALFHCHFLCYILLFTDSYTLDQLTWNLCYRIYHNSVVLLKSPKGCYCNCSYPINLIGRERQRMIYWTSQQLKGNLQILGITGLVKSVIKITWLGGNNTWNTMNNWNTLVQQSYSHLFGLYNNTAELW